MVCSLVIDYPTTVTLQAPFKSRTRFGIGVPGSATNARANETHAIGGVDGTAFLGSVETRRVRGDGEWHDVAPMPTPRSNHAVGVLDGMIYAIGGIVDGDRGTDVVERYDPMPINGRRVSRCRPLAGLHPPRAWTECSTSPVASSTRTTPTTTNTPPAPSSRSIRVRTAGRRSRRC
jgi:hypothetical protein